MQGISICFQQKDVCEWGKRERILPCVVGSGVTRPWGLKTEWRKWPSGPFSQGQVGGGAQLRQRVKNTTSWSPRRCPRCAGWRWTASPCLSFSGLKGPFGFNLEIPREEFQQSRFRGVIGGWSLFLLDLGKQSGQVHWYSTDFANRFVLIWGCF